MAHCLFPRRADGQQFKHLPPRNTGFGPPILTQEALRLSKSFGQLLGSFCLSWLHDIPKEDYDLKFRVCRAEILKFVRPRVGGSDENLGYYPLADWKAWSKGLVGDVGDRRRSVVNADPRSEPPEGLESPSDYVSRRFRGAESPVNLLQELFMRNPVLVPLRCRFSREQSRELAVKVNQILCVFPSFELVLCLALSGCYTV